jgi:hypothetical protein
MVTLSGGGPYKVIAGHCLQPVAYTLKVIIAT